jgi:hypothetical protein
MYSQERGTKEIVVKGINPNEYTHYKSQGKLGMFSSANMWHFVPKLKRYPCNNFDWKSPIRSIGYKGK